MPGKPQARSSILYALTHAVTATLVLSILFALTVLSARTAQGQTFKVIYNFSEWEPERGEQPYSLTIDKAGNLYGTTYAGGDMNQCCGTLFRLRRTGTDWVLDNVYLFNDNDSRYLWGSGNSSVFVAGPDGSLYGTSNSSDGVIGCGTYPCGKAFSFSQPPPYSVRWKQTSIHRFNGYDGAGPGNVRLIFDEAGDIYGVAAGGGDFGRGVVYELVPSQDGWTETVLHYFTGYPDDAAQPTAAVTFDSAGNIFGTAYVGGSQGYGAVYQLTPSQSGWIESLVYSFQGGNDGGYPRSGVISDPAGNLYGTTSGDILGGNDAVYMLSPLGGNRWKYTQLRGFPRTKGPFPQAGLVRDAAGNLYGTAMAFPGAWGSVFKLTPSNGGWTYTDLYDFSGGSDGGNPCCSSLVMDANGNLYGTTTAGGSGAGVGVVFEITP